MKNRIWWIFVSVFFILFLFVIAYWTYPVLETDWFVVFTNLLDSTGDIYFLKDLEGWRLNVYHPATAFLLLKPFQLVPGTGLARVWAQMWILRFVIVTVILFFVTVIERDNHIRFYMLLVVLLSRNTNSLLVQGQVIWIAILGLALVVKSLRLKHNAPYVAGLGLTGLFSIPPNTIPLIFWTFWQMRHWSIKSIAKVFIFPLLIFIGSLAIFGVKWPLSMIRAWFIAPDATSQANMSIWKYDFWYVIVILVIVITVILYYRNRRFDLAWMVMCTYLLSPYILGYRLVVPLLVALPVVIRFNRFIAFALLIASYTRILVGGVGWWYESWVLAFVLALALFLGNSTQVDKKQIFGSLG